ncbi:MAG: hypothetical protein IPP63_19135 [Chloracidobacterium sp.]|nr:hypothetical protein [Chloracidobacterium sp.]
MRLRPASPQIKNVCNWILGELTLELSNSGKGVVEVWRLPRISPRLLNTISSGSINNNQGKTKFSLRCSLLANLLLRLLR